MRVIFTKYCLILSHAIYRVIFSIQSEPVLPSFITFQHRVTVRVSKSSTGVLVVWVVMETLILGQYNTEVVLVNIIID